MNVYAMMKDIAARGLANQTIGEKDYYDENDILICGVCGEPRQRFMMIADPTKEDKDHQSPLKVARACKCDRDREAAIEAEEKRKREMQAIAALRSASLMDDRLAEATFDKFTHTGKNEDVYRVCKRYADQFELMVSKNQGLLLCGGVGTGKTFAAACIANQLLDKGIPVVMTSFVRLIQLIQNGDMKDTEIIEKMKRAKLVIFDDLGAERSTDYALEKVYSIVDARYGQKLPCIFTSNIPLKEMQEDDDVRFSRIYDRIFSNCYPLQLTGASWRKREAGRRFVDMGKFFDDKEQTQ